MWALVLKAAAAWVFTVVGHSFGRTVYYKRWFYQGMSEVYCSILPMKDFEIQLSINADTYTLLSSGHLHVVTTLVTLRLDGRFVVVYT